MKSYGPANTQFSSSAAEFQPSSANIVRVTETTIINSSEGTKRFNTQETYEASHPERPLSHHEHEA